MIKQLAYSAIVGGCLAITACGGGGSSSSSDSGSGNGAGTGGGSGGGSTSQRISRFSADYDNNGIADAVETSRYDNNGRLIATLYTYTDDGTADIINLNEEGAREVSFDYTYNSQGQMTSWVKDIAFIDPASVGPGRIVRQEFSAAYDSNGLVTEAIITGFSISGAQLTSQRFEPRYNGNVMSSFIGFINNLQTYITTFTYDSSGLPILAQGDYPAIEIAPGVTTDAFSTAYDFEWNTNRQNTRVVFSSPDPTNSGNGFTSTVDSVFNSDAQLVSQQWLASPITDPTIWSLNSDLRFSYDAQNQRLTQISWDLNRDGSIDATINYEWEASVCTPVYFWLPQSLVPNIFLGNVPDNAHPSLIPGTGFQLFDHCAD